MVHLQWGAISDDAIDFSHTIELDNANCVALEVAIHGFVLVIYVGDAGDYILVVALDCSLGVDVAQGFLHFPDGVGQYIAVGLTHCTLFLILVSDADTFSGTDVQVIVDKGHLIVTFTRTEDYSRGYCHQ